MTRFMPGAARPRPLPHMGVGTFPTLLALLLLLLQAGPLVGQIGQGEYAERRAALAAAIGDGLLLGVGNTEPPQDYLDFFQNSPFRYLTGFTEPNAALVALVRDGRIERETLFVNPRDAAQETWEGYRIGPDATRALTGIDGRPVGELQAVLDSLVTAGWTEVRLVGPYSPNATIRNDVTQRVEALFRDHPGVRLAAVNQQVSRLREIKSPAELALLRRATTITTEAHRQVLATLAPGLNEFEMQALIEFTFRRNGSERPAFSSIVGSGRNSTVLHYNTNDRFMEEGDVVVMDIGASYGGYAADVTRTYPVSGRFTEPQREIYQLVRDAQAAAERLAGPGTPVAQMNQTATMVLAQGLAELGLIEAPNATFLAANGQQMPQYFLFYMHALGHGIGLDVHDPWPAVLAEGAAFTIEPGIYVRPNLFTEVIPDVPANRAMIEAIRPAFERYVNIGVRIEDDYIVTADGLEWISPVPREIDEIEALLAEPRQVPTTRNAEWVEWYRGMP